MQNNQHLNGSILIIISLITVGIICTIDPIKQDLGYHQFADQRTRFSIQNFINVISNIPFMLIGLLGILHLNGKNIKIADCQPITPFFVFFMGVFFTGIGSAYYHLNPSNETLFWDRFPMTISFMAFFTNRN